LPEFWVLVAQNNYDIIGITESWCYNSINDSELPLKDYNFFNEADRNLESGGGVTIDGLQY